MGMPVEGSYSQDGFRFRNDDGSETSATWLAAAGTNVVLGETTFRLRIRVQQTVTGMTDNADNIEGTSRSASAATAVRIPM